MAPFTILLCVLVFADSAAYSLVIPLLPYAADRLGASLLTVGALFASYSLFQMAGAPLLGAVSDRIGRRGPLLASQAGTALGFGLLLGPVSLPVLFVSRAIDGATAGNISLLYASVLDHVPAKEWGRRFSWLGAASGAGILGGILTGTALAGRGLPLLAGVALALVVACIVVTAVAFPGSPVRTARVRAVDSWRRTAAHPEGGPLRFVLLLVLIATVTQTAFLLALPAFLLKVLALDERGTLPFLAVLFAAAAVFQVLVLPRLFVAGARRVAACAFAGCVAGGAGLGVATSLVPVFLSAVALIAGIAALGPSLTTLVSERNADSRLLEEGALMGLQQTVVSVGQLLGPLAGYGALAVGGPLGYGLACAGVAGTGLALIVLRSGR